MDELKTALAYAQFLECEHSKNPKRVIGFEKLPGIEIDVIFEDDTRKRFTGLFASEIKKRLVVDEQYDIMNPNLANFLNENNSGDNV